MQINIWPTENGKEYTRACDCKRRSQQTLPIGRSWPNRNQSYDKKIVRSGLTGGLFAHTSIDLSNSYLYTVIQLQSSHNMGVWHRVCMIYMQKEGSELYGVNIYG